jgi:hypothetical protein
MSTIQTKQPFENYVDDMVRIENTVEIDGGYIIDFFIPDAERSVPSTISFDEEHTTEEFVIRLPTLPKAVWSEKEVRETVEKIATSIGLSTQDITITPGLRREPRRSKVDPSANWHPHLEITQSLSEENASRIVNQVANRDRLIVAQQ